MTNAKASILPQLGGGVGNWNLDPSRTVVRIKHRTMWGAMTVRGVFTDVHGVGTITENHVVTGTITVGAASVDTKNSKRDKHLRSTQFFDVENHPSFTVTVHSVAAAGDLLELSGELTVKNVREPLTLTAEITELGANILETHISGTVDRHRFGLSFNQMGMIRGLTGLDIDAVFTRATD